MGIYKNILLTLGVLIIVGISFSLGLFTGWKFSRPGKEELQLPISKPKMTTPRPVPSTPIFIIPNRPAPSSPPKPKIQKPMTEIIIAPTNAPQPPNIITTPPAKTETPQEAPQPQKAPSSQGEQKLFKVTIGPMDQEEAKKLQDSLSKEGKEAILVPADGKFKLQLGAFLKKENAQQLVDELKSKGYNPTVEEK